MSSSAQPSEQIERTRSQLNQCTEHYEVSGKFAVRRVVLPSGQEVITKIVIDPTLPKGEDAQSIFDYSYLRLKVKPEADFSEEISSADLFCSCGCLSLGALEACNAIGKKFTPIVATDIDPNSVAVYKDNFKPLKTYSVDISTLIDGVLGSKPTINELKLQKDCFGIGTSLSLLLAGPPCQGYSSLNNYHRQDDGRNILYERVARFVELTSPTSVLIENVPTVIHSEDKVVGKTIQLMEDEGYLVDSGIINLADIGVPQLRKRHVVVASKRKKVSIKDVVEKHRVPSKRIFEWAAGELQDEPPVGLLSTPTNPSEDNKRRMTYLHDKQIYDLPNEMRPQCHQKKHGYKSMYGRIRIAEPTQTITSGFTSPGQGRYTHPTKVRTITPHEAARLQLIPDFFDFSKATKRRHLSMMIGNGAPMKLSYVFCLELLT